MKKTAFIVFLIAALGELVSILADIQFSQMIFKPLIMISLGFYYYTASPEEERSRLVLGAIVFALAGDVLLMLPDKFIPGLIAFLVCHLFYIFAYRQYRGEERGDALKGVHRMRLAVPVILGGSGLAIILYPVLGAMKIPVMIYAIVITSMVLAALFRIGKTTTSSFWMVFLGALLFMLSDSIIAINKFLSPISMAGFWIMLTYMTAQFLIIRGLLKHE
jgi:uncharacterized membrane protein YhhN